MERMSFLIVLLLISSHVLRGTAELASSATESRPTEKIRLMDGKQVFLKDLPPKVKGIPSTQVVLQGKSKSSMLKKSRFVDFSVPFSLFQETFGLTSKAGEWATSLFFGWPLALVLAYVGLLAVYPNRRSDNAFERTIAIAADYLQDTALYLEDQILTFLEIVTEPLDRSDRNQTEFEREPKTEPEFEEDSYIQYGINASEAHHPHIIASSKPFQYPYIIQYSNITEYPPIRPGLSQHLYYLNHNSDNTGGYVRFDENSGATSNQKYGYNMVHKPILNQFEYSSPGIFYREQPAFHQYEPASRPLPHSALGYGNLIAEPPALVQAAPPPHILAPANNQDKLTNKLLLYDMLYAKDKQKFMDAVLSPQVGPSLAAANQKDPTFELILNTVSKGDETGGPDGFSASYDITVLPYNPGSPGTLTKGHSPNSASANHPDGSSIRDNVWKVAPHKAHLADSLASLSSASEVVHPAPPSSTSVKFSVPFVQNPPKFPLGPPTFQPSPFAGFPNTEGTEWVGKHSIIS